VTPMTTAGPSMLARNTPQSAKTLPVLNGTTMRISSAPSTKSFTAAP